MTCETLRELSIDPDGEQEESTTHRLGRIMRRHTGDGYRCCDWCLLVENIKAREERIDEAQAEIRRLQEAKP